VPPAWSSLGFTLWLGYRRFLKHLTCTKVQSRKITTNIDMPERALAWVRVQAREMAACGSDVPRQRVGTGRPEMWTGHRQPPGAVRDTA
jgi:hypothetical protein